MRAERRTRFATSFVAIVGCSGGPRTEPRPPQDPVAIAREMDALPDRVSVPVDAAVADATAIDARTTPPDRRNPNDRAPYFDPCGGPPDPGQMRCNPPPPSRVEIEARLLAVNVQGSGVILTVAAGSRQGVQNNWRAELRAGKTVLPHRVLIIRVSERTTFLSSSSIGEPRDDMRVWLSPTK